MVGKTVSHYKIVGKLGQGGMGVVYRATDLRLERDVALKFLPDALAGDQQALERLKREARAGALSHPNICAVYDIGESEGHPFICMELLEGETLEQRLARGALPIADVLTFGIQIAGALAAAHAKGIIHRDVKPSNIFVTEFDQIKLMDFGLARKSGAALRARVAETATASVLPDQLSTPGVAIGTLLYMSPEQARGEELDARSDLFSFGAVLYEMASGRRPFQGTNPALILDAILHAEPAPPSRLNPAIPPELDAVVLKALEKARDTRYQSAADLAADLKRIKRGTESGRTTVAQLLPPAPRRWGWYAAAAAFLAIAVAAGLLLWQRQSSPAPAPQSEWVQLTNFTDSAVSPALSPDGRMLAFIRGSDTFLTPGEVYIKMLPSGDPVQLTHDETIKMGVAFSPDGSRVTYTVLGTNWDTWSVPVLGGEPHLMLPNAAGLTWIGPRHVLFSEIRSGMHMSLATATETRAEHRDVYVPPRERGMAHRSAISPDGQWVLLAEMDNSGWLPCRLVPSDGSQAGRNVGPLSGGCTYVAWSPDGAWIYFASDATGQFHLWRQKFAGGEPQQLTFGPTEEEGIAIAPDGKSLVTSVGISQSSVWLHDKSGEHQLSTEGSAAAPQFSPDGRSAYFLVRPGGTSAQFTAGELWKTDPASGATEQVFPGVVMTSYAISPDGKQVAFSSNGNGQSIVWVAPLDHRTPPRRLQSSFSEDQPQFLPGGDLLVRAAEGAANNVYRISADGTRREKAITAPVLSLNSVSPDGNWVTVRVPSDDPERPVLVAAYPLNGGKRVSICTSDCSAGWSANGKSFWIEFFAMREARTIIFSLSPGKTLPDLPPQGIDDLSQIAKLHDARVLPGAITAGAEPSQHLFARVTVQRNLYRIPLR